MDPDQVTMVDRVYARGQQHRPRALVPMAAGSGVAAAVAINARVSIDDADRAVAAASGAGAPASQVR